MQQVLGRFPLYIEFQASKGCILRSCLKEIKNPSPLPQITLSWAQCVLTGLSGLCLSSQLSGGKRIVCTQEFGFSLDNTVRHLCLYPHYSWARGWALVSVHVAPCCVKPLRGELFPHQGEQGLLTPLSCLASSCCLPKDRP